MKKIILALALLLFLPLAYAFDCNSISKAHYQTCQEINNLDLTEEEKDLILSNLEYDSKFYPNHDYIYNRNTNLNINNPPDDTQKHNSYVIKNAWMSFLTVMPSVIYKNNTYVPNNIKALSKYDYQIKLPSNYYSSGYPTTNQGDCKRTYSLTNNNAYNRFYVNNDYQTYGSLVDLNINSDAEIKSRYSIHANIDVNHYRWNTYCCRTRNKCVEHEWIDGCCKKRMGECVKPCKRRKCVRRERVCIEYCHECKYNNDETQTDSVVITDSINVKKYNNNPKADIDIIDQYSDTTKLQLNHTNSVKLTTQDSLFEFNEFMYDIKYSKEPYYIYTLKAEDYNQEKIKNMIKDDSNLLIKDTKDCKLNFFDFFNMFEKDCNLDHSDVDLSISTDKLKYKPNELIKVSVKPPDILVKVSYGNVTKEGSGLIGFVAESPHNKITAEYQGVKAEKVIFIADEDRFVILFNLGLFGLMNWFFYKVLKGKIIK